MGSSSFAEVSLADIVDFRNGKAIPPEKYTPEGKHPVFGSNGQIACSDEVLCPDPTIVIGRVGAYCGCVHYVPKASWVTDNAIVALPQEGNDIRYLYYLLGSLERTAIGSTQPLMTQKGLKVVQTKIPPLPEQKAIAHILGSLDGKIELNRRMNATLEGMAQALFKSWFVDFDPVIDNALAVSNPIPDELAPRAEVRRQALATQKSAATNQQGTCDEPTLLDRKSHFPAAFQFTEELGWIPEGWEITNFGEVSTCFDRKRIPLSKKQREEKKPGTIPYYGAASIMDFIGDWIFDDTYLLVGEDGSVMKKDGSPFVQYIWGKTWVNNHAHVIQGNEEVSTEHLMLFMQSQNIAAYVTGAVQLKINQGNMNSIPFLNAGNPVNQRFAECITPFYERIKLLTEINETLTKLRDTLLPKLISGELRIPATETLPIEIPI